MSRTDTTGQRWDALEPTRCTVCRRTQARLAYEINGHKIVRCACCQHLYVSPRPPMERVIEIYGEDYFENPAFKTTDHDAYFGYMDYLRDRENIQLRLRQVLSRIERHEWRGRLLDVGCGLGLFVEVAQLAGWEAWGVDLNRHAVKWARQHVTGNVRWGKAAAVDAADGSFDCITMFDVIEHLNDPRQELGEIWRLLRPGGLLVIVTPDAGSLVSRALGSHWLEMKRAPEHLHFFTVKGLAQMLALGGFTAFEWHSIGKISTVRTMLADLRFYSQTFFAGAEATLDRFGWADRVIDVDPRTKLCLYARKTREPSAIDWDGPLDDIEVRRISRHGLGRSGVRWVRRHGAETKAPTRAVEIEQKREAAERFRARQRRYWESKERFLDPRLPGPRAFADPKLDWIERLVPLDVATSVLDVGAGNGTTTWYLAQRAGRVVGVDFSQNLLVRSPCKHRLVQADAAQLPFPDDQFDVVFESNFLHHVADPATVLREMRRVARHHVVLVEPNRWHLPMSVFMAAKRSEWRGLRFDRRFLEALASTADLELLDAEPQGAIYPNQTPPALLGPLRRFDRPGPLRAYFVAVLAVRP